MLDGVHVVELAGTMSGAYCGRILAAHGATTWLIEASDTALREGELRRFMHAGKVSVDADEVVAGHAIDAVIRPFGSPSATEAAADVLVFTGAPWERAGRCDEAPVRLDLPTLQYGAMMAIRIVSALLGGWAADAFAALATELGSAAPVDRARSVGWPRTGLMEAADGWVVSSPSSLPPKTLAALIASESTHAARTPDEALARWVASRSRMQVFETLQAWRTPFTPVLDVVEASAFRVRETGESTGRTAS